MKEKLKKLHEKNYKTLPSDYYFAPGRVNLIGEHTDYAGGHVLPVALSIGIYASVSKREDMRVQVYSDSFPDEGIKTIDLETLDNYQEEGYMAYVKGMFYKFKREKYPCTHGLDITIMSNLPKSSGLSSSAALECLIGFLLIDQFDLDLDKLKLARYARFVENHYLNLQSGIMDSFVITHGKKDHAVFLNTKTLSYELVPFKMENHTLVMMNTNKSRNLIDSNYNDRVESIEEATRYFEDCRPIEVLCDLDLDSFHSLKANLKDSAIIQRVEHVLFENDRTIQARDVLVDEDYEMFGDFMVQSHESLRYLYEVSCAELDFLVTENLNLGALGARMTGAGFGGTMIALYENSKLPKDFQDLINAYYKTFKKDLEIYTAKASDGVKKL